MLNAGNTKTSLLLATSPWGFRLTPIDQQCRWLKCMGFGYICCHIGDFPGALPLNAQAADIARARALFDEFDLRVASVNANGDFMVSDNVDREIAVACADIDRAAQLQALVVIVFAGWVERDDAQVYTQVSAALKRVARHAATYGLNVALENHGGLTRTAAQINRLLAAADEPNLGVNYDPANFSMYGEDPLLALTELRSPIFYTHFKNLKTENGNKRYCRLAEGVIDYRPILNWLYTRYHGIYALEYENTSDVFEGTADDLRTLTRWQQENSKRDNR